MRVKTRKKKKKVKKNLKNFVKPLDKVGGDVVYYWSCQRAAHEVSRKARGKQGSEGTERKKLEKSLKKPLDKGKTKWYNKQAAERKRGQ